MQAPEAALESTANMEKPQNGIAGLKHWRSDMLAGLMVSLVSLPFSLGIAIASGAPPVAGLVSAIIAGAIYPFLGGSFVTISGPAAGLAPAIFVAMTTLGHGDRDVGYPLLLGVICMVGVVQIILSRLKVARFSAWFSPTVVEGMLASIGLLIIVKQIPNLIGQRFEAHDFWEILAELPAQLVNTQPIVLLVGLMCLALTIVLTVARNRWTKIVPPPLTVVVFGLLLGWVLQIDKGYMIKIPDDPLRNGMVFPNFHGLFADHTLWLAIFTTVVTLTLIDGVESLATIAGIDKIDPYKRKSSPDRTLMAMGISNICSSVAGGLTIIPGGVKSTTCIVTGGKTLWANFYNAVFLVMYLFLAKDLINLIPLSALSAIVVFIGYKLCKPKVWKHVAHIGSEQLLVFATTVLVTVSTDLLLGILSGMTLELLLNVSLAWPVRRVALAAPAASGDFAAAPFRFFDLFRNPVSNRELVADQYHVYFGRPLVSFNSLYVNRELARIPQQATSVHFHLGESVTLIDHMSSANLMSFARDYEASGRGLVQFTGLKEMFMCSNDETCVRLNSTALAGATAKGGLSALLKKFGRYRFIGSENGSGAADAGCLPARPRFATQPDDMGFMSLSATGEAELDVSQVGPAPGGDAASELGRLSLSWDGTIPRQKSAG
ncbi:MAG TPA: SulP family inorganic anion transporter [Planctomycetaceae bacterium]|nr:SulP family inorganic anion transporter [Planctomycetaceae bacterium]